MLEDTENWLYEEGEDQEKEVYQDKLSELKVGINILKLTFIFTCYNEKDIFCLLLNLAYF